MCKFFLCISDSFTSHLSPTRLSPTVYPHEQIQAEISHLPPTRLFPRHHIIKSVREFSLAYPQLALLCFPEFLPNIFYPTLAPQRFLSHTCSPTFSIPCSLPNIFYPQIAHLPSAYLLSAYLLSAIISYPPISYPPLSPIRLSPIRLSGHSRLTQP